MARDFFEQEDVTLLVEQVNAETDKAWLMVLEGDEYWLPKSQCDYDLKHKTVTIPAWLAKEKGLY